jgi:hypothetical protein
MTPDERKAAERQRKKTAGLVRCEVWVHPADVASVRRWAESLNEDRAAADRMAQGEQA